MDRDRINWDLVRKVEQAEAASKEAQRNLSDHLITLCKFSKGDIVRDKDSGARYRVDGMSGYVVQGRPNLHIQATRVYATGRRDARSTSFLNESDLELVEATDAPA